MNEIPLGQCQCGCGKQTPIYKCTNKKRGTIKGQPSKFLCGHNQRLNIKSCNVDGCNIKAKARGLCNAHYLRKWHTGELYEDVPVKKGIEDLSGKEFGGWTVISLSHLDNKRRMTIWNCVCKCGAERKVRGTALKTGVSTSCGCMIKRNYGEKHAGWKGGRRKLNGYVLIRKKQPNNNTTGYISEHRDIMSNHIGRPLKKGELVHHKNGIKDDNRLENLELLTYANHVGEITCPHCGGNFFIK